MPRVGLDQLRKKRKFQLEGENDVIILFGKYSGLSFRRISKLEPEYFQFLLDSQEGKVSEEIRRRMIYWANKYMTFWI